MRGRHFTDPRRSQDQRMPDLVADVHPESVSEGSTPWMAESPAPPFSHLFNRI